MTRTAPFLAALSRRRLFFDGSTGTMLQAAGLPPGHLPELWNLERPDAIVALHAAYLRAGANILTTNTFGANSLKFPVDATADRPSLATIVHAAVRNARAAIVQEHREDSAFVALDIGPSGKLLAPLGDLAFEDAVALFAAVAGLAASAGADLILLETFNDAYETKAAVLAAREAAPTLPLVVSNTYDEHSTLLSGTPPEVMVAMLEGLRVDVVGANCGLGPDKLLPVARRLCAATHVPVMVNPNAGLPVLRDGRTTYPATPDEFAAQMARIADLGPAILGGCCGTRPEHIAAMVSHVGQRGFQNPARGDSSATAPDLLLPPLEPAIVTSWSQCVAIGLPDRPAVAIGERINPTGKKAVQAALRAGDISFALTEAISQKKDGAEVLDVNVGVPGIDEPAMLLRTVTELQAVTDLPLQLDTSDPKALAVALRAYNGKPLVNSVSAKEASLAAVLPLVAKYGGVLVALALDDDGIPADPKKRLAIAQRIIAAATEQGIPARDILVDPLAMAVAAEPGAAQATLEALRLLRASGIKTILGVSNISHGLPLRPLLNATFLTLAMQAGLSAAILNPHSRPMVDAIRAFGILTNRDPRAARFLAYAAARPADIPAVAKSAAFGPKPDSSAATPNSSSTPFDNLRAAIASGLRDAAAEAARELLAAPEPPAPLDLVTQGVIPALDAVGRDYEAHRAFLPNLLMSAEAAQAAFNVVQGALADTGAAPRPKKYPIVLATVQGDIHDIGKNIVATLLRNYDYDVIDLGKDVPPEKILEAAKKASAPLVGLSALMTTTVPAMEKTIALLHREYPSAKVVVGGAVLTPAYAAEIHADAYSPDAMSTVRYAESLL